MDIKNLTAHTPNNRVSDNANTANRNSVNNSGSDAKSADKVTLTSSANELEQKAQVTTVDNSQRIAELKQAIKDGSYQVNAESVASKLIETEALLAGA